ncbi:hypothetical protein [Mesorhizobium sp. M1403]|uniref:hypothetical protein n=1 Tax=Mesorhizobium sp. M1403 TaxID=2957097 RepID=UPI00333E0027
MPVYPGKIVESQSLLLRVLVQLLDTRPANATVKINPAEGGMCLALETLGAAFAASATLVIGLRDDDNSVRQ